MRAGVLLLALLVTAPLPAQRGLWGGEEPPEVDPYTGGDRELRLGAGIRRYGPLPWADGHGSRDIEEMVGRRILWVETAHFRIGSTLPWYRLPRDKAQREKIRAELERLAERLLEVDPKTRRLDPWLRLHLFALRVEDLYAELEAILGVGDADFPKARGERPGGRWMGEGPYLGMPAPYTLLLLEKQASLGRYAAAWLPPGPVEVSRRHNFPETGTLFLGVSTEMNDGLLRDDTVLHVHVVFGLTHNLVDGYKFYGHELPVWCKEGLAHCLARRVDPHSNNFTKVVEEQKELRSSWDWAPRVRARVRHRYYPSFAEMLAWRDYQALTFANHMILWSRVDFLLSLGEEGFGRFLGLMKERIVESGLPTWDQVLARQEEALQEAWGMGPEELEEAWRAWVLRTYPRR